MINNITKQIEFLEGNGDSVKEVEHIKRVYGGNPNREHIQVVLAEVDKYINGMDLKNNKELNIKNYFLTLKTELTRIEKDYELIPVNEVKNEDDKEYNVAVNKQYERRVTTILK